MAVQQMGLVDHTNVRHTSLCFVAHFAYGALTGGSSGHVGGVERQTSLMAKWFAGEGYRVTFLTWDEGQEEERIIDGVRVIKMCRRDEGLPGLRFFHPRWTSLNRAMRQADADVYYQNTGEYVTGQVALWCQRHARKFVYSAASDPDCDARLPEMKEWRVRTLYRYGLRHADRIIVQTQTQRDLLRSSFGLGSIVLPMPCPEVSPCDMGGRVPERRNPFTVGWVGRFVKLKRLELLLEVAKTLPDVLFEVAGGERIETDYGRQLRSQAGQSPNVRLHGMLSRDEMVGFYRRVDCLCCTSVYEGFPNTFLEAWSCGLPVVSTFDPDRLIARHNLGFSAQGAPDLIRSLCALRDSPELWNQVSLNARRYYLQNHAVEVAMPRFEAVFREVLDRTVRRDGEMS